MGFWRSANKEDVKRVMTPDGEDWVDLRVDFTKDEVNKIIIHSPKGEGDIAGSLSFIERFAEIAVNGWSKVDDSGKAVPFSMKEYKSLSHEQSQWLDKVLAEHISNTFGSGVENLENEPEG